MSASSTVSLTDAHHVLEWPFPRTSDGRPPRLLADLRRASACPVQLPGIATEARRAWLVTSYDDVAFALSDPRLSADEQRPGAPVRIQIPPDARPSSFLRMDDPEHARLRTMIATEFTARRVRAVRPVVQARIDELLDELAAQPGAADLQASFTRDLPTTIIADVLGVPTEDNVDFVTLTRTILAQDDPVAGLAAYNRMTEFLLELVQRKLSEPGDDLISRAAHTYVRSARATAEEIAGIARLVLVAGHETTTNQLALGVLSLLLDPSLQAQVLADDGALIPAYVEEAMRFWSISQDAIVRQVTTDLQLGGVTMRAGDAVVVSIPGGNHDPAVFPEPHTIRLDRRSAKHLQWGFGPHFCQGAPLARLEQELALRSLFGRFPDLALAVPDPAPLFRVGTVFFGVESLPVTW